MLQLPFGCVRVGKQKVFLAITPAFSTDTALCPYTHWDFLEMLCGYRPRIERSNASARTKTISNGDRSDRYVLTSISVPGVLVRVILSVLALFVRSLQRLRPETEIRYEQEWARNYGQVCRYDSGSAGTEMRRIRRRLRCQQD
jgi:hypothetical protein